MKKIALGVLFGALVFLPIGATAARLIDLPWTNNIYRVSSTEVNADTVSVFDDADNKCYVLSSDVSTHLAISCVKQ